MAITLEPLPFGSEYSMKNIPRQSKKDKSSNKYCASKCDYNNEVKKYVTSSYKKANESKVHESNLKAAQIAQGLGLDDRI